MLIPTKLYGERNTNTNYLERLIGLNLRAYQLPGVVPAWVRHLQRVLYGGEHARDLYFRITFRRNLGWKHTRVMSPAELAGYRVRERGICFVTITKNPYSWLLSLYRRPYHQQKNTGSGFERFLSAPWQTVRRDNCGSVMLENPIELWNLKNASYLPLAELNALNVRTEDIFRDPEAIIDRIGSHFGIERISPEFRNQEASVKESGKTFFEYRNYYLGEKWRSRLSREAVELINASLDPSLMRQFGYDYIEV